MIKLTENKENLLNNSAKMTFYRQCDHWQCGQATWHVGVNKRKMLIWRFQQNINHSLVSTHIYSIRVTAWREDCWKFLTICKFSSKHNSTWPRHPKTVEQRIMPKVEVDKCSFNSNLGKTQPKCHLQRPTFHKKGHHITRDPPLSSSPVGHCVGQLIQLCKGPCFSCSLIDQCWFIWVAFHCLGKYGKYVTSIAHVTPQRQLHS